MKELAQFNWQAFATKPGLKFAIGIVVLMLFQNATGESWVITSLVLLFAWLANTPGPLKDRIGGMAVFSIGAIFCAVIASLIGPNFLSGVLALAFVGLLGTVMTLWGRRAGMVGWAIVMYMIYAPSFVAATGLENSILTILLGVGILLFLSMVSALKIGRAHV